MAYGGKKNKLSNEKRVSPLLRHSKVLNILGGREPIVVLIFNRY